MAGGKSNKQPIFALYPLIRSKDTGAVGTQPIGSFQNSIPGDQIMELLAVDPPEGYIVERVTATFQTNNGESNTAQIVVLAIRDAESGAWHIYKREVVASVTVNFTSAVAPATVTFEFEGGLLLEQSTAIGIGHTALNGAYDELHAILEGGTFTNDQTG